jgi:phosphoserine phosphatase RsbU/P
MNPPPSRPLETSVPGSETKRKLSRELAIQTPDGAVKNVPLGGERVSLGRTTANDLCFADDPGLSRQHLEFELKDGQWLVRDLGSRNGTYVNGKQITGEHGLHPGDRIAAGHLMIDFRIGGSDTEHTIVFVEPGPSAAHATTIETDLAGALIEPAVTSPVKAQSTAPTQALILAGQQLSGHMPLDQLFRLVLDLSIEAVGAARGVLMTVEGDELVAQAATGGEFQISTLIRDRVVNKRTSVLIYDALGDADLRFRESIVSQSIRSIMAVPLQTEARVIGLIYVDAAGILMPFTKEHLSLLTVMANIAAIRIEQARLQEVERIERIYEHDLSQAAEIQAQLLPAAPPQVPGLEMLGCNIPCRTVGGDYFDYFLCPDGRVTLLVGDVSGKGMPAALLMSSLQARLQVLSEMGLPPATLVARLNQGLTARTPGNRFITFFFSIYDPATGELTYCNAGHNPPLVLRRDGSIELLEAGGLVLGLVAAAPYQEGKVTLQPGEEVILFSDGVTEANGVSGDEEFGEERLAQTVKRLAPLPVGNILDEVVRTLRVWTGGKPFADDVTLLVARRV